jgi:hypothetical protein
MSLYNTLFGFDRTAAPALSLLGLSPSQIPRFRDAHFKWADGVGSEVEIWVYTRTGGGNRADYEAENQALREVAGFKRDFDDGFDSTFANWVYRVPDDFWVQVHEWLVEFGEPLTGEQKWAEFFKNNKPD